MIKKTLIVGLTSIITLASAVTVTHAKDTDLYFYPKTKWQVSDTPNAQGVCTYKNTMNNGYVVTLHGTRGRITALEINFRQDIFEKGINYEVQYTIPGRKKAIVSSHAQNGALLVSDLRKNDAFGATMLNASTVDVKIRDNAFRLYLTGLDASRDAYNECLTPSKPSNNIASRTEPNIDQAAVETLASTRNIPDTVYDDVVKNNLAPPPPPTTAQNLNLGVDASSAQRPSFDRPRYTEQLASEIDQHNDLYKADQQHVPSARQESQDLLTVDSHDIIATPQQKETNVVASQETLDETEIAPSVKPTHAEPEAKTVSQEIAIEEDVLASNTALDETANVLASIEPASNNPSETLDVLSHIAQEETEHMRQQIKMLEEKVATLRSQNTTLDQEIKSRVKETEQERLSVSSDNWNLERATMRFNEAERQILRLGRQLQTQRAQCDQEKASLETMLFDPKLTEQQQLAKLSLLESGIEEKESELYRQKRQYEERIKILEDRLNVQ